MWSEQNGFVDSLRQKNIEFVKMLSADVEAYKQEWFQKFVPLDKQEKALECYCFNRDDTTVIYGMCSVMNCWIALQKMRRESPLMMYKKGKQYCW